MDSFVLGVTLLLFLVIFGPPLMLLAVARVAFRDGHLSRAEGLATVAVVWSWLPLAASGLALLLLLSARSPLWIAPEAAAPLAASVPIWFWSRTLAARIRERRETEAAAAPSRDAPR